MPLFTRNAIKPIAEEIVGFCLENSAEKNGGQTRIPADKDAGFFRIWWDGHWLALTEAAMRHVWRLAIKSEVAFVPNW